jgi:hypothetical protein
MDAPQQTLELPMDAISAFHASPCSAVLSPCRLYRYDLWRRWSDAPYCMFVGLNPSTADETQDDPTIRRCVGYAKRWNYGGLCMVNLFAFRATQPRDMMAAQDPIGPDNDRTLKTLSQGAGIVIAAWGKDGNHMGRDKQVMALLPHLYCLKQNKDGSPAHPLYLRGDATPYPLNGEMSHAAASAV